MKFFAGVLAGLILASAYFLTRPPVIAEKTKVEFRAFTEEEARAFADAPDEASKLRAAEALYGKMMVLFLANLGLHLKESRPVLPAETSAPIESKLAVVTPEVPPLQCPPCAEASQGLTEKKARTSPLTTPEKFRSAPYFTKLDANLRKLNGVFAGKLSYFSGTRRGKIDSALIDVNLVQKQETLDGEIGVILTDENGKAYSRNRGRGGNKSIRYIPSEKTVFVEASPNSFFSFRMQEFHDGEVRGEYFEDNALVGKALLYRQ